MWGTVPFFFYALSEYCNLWSFLVAVHEVAAGCVNNNGQTLGGAGGER